MALVEKTKVAAVEAGIKSDFIFRGQNEDKPLLPKIARPTLQPKGNLPKTEQLMMEEFKRLRLPFSDFEPKNEWDSLALAQHHGLPTRLLDWSYSALIALWVCVKDLPKKDEQGNESDGVVWLLKTRKDEFINFPIPGGPYALRRTRIFRPRWLSPRIPAQAGIFTCHQRLPKGKFIPLEANPNFRPRLVKFVVPARRFSAIRDQLYSCGVTDVALFPDLDGLSRFLQYRYFHQSDAARVRQKPRFRFMKPAS